MPDTYDIVNATKLDACCTAEANAIRAKTGSSAQIAYDWANSKGFADAIAAIPSGGSSQEDEILDGSISGMYSNHNITTLRAQALRTCSLITGVCFPALTTALTESLEDMTSLAIADLGQLGSIPTRTLQNDAALATIILRKTSLVTLMHTNNVIGTPFRNGGPGGTIYIPKVLYDALGSGTNDYKAASNWSTIDAYGTITWAQIEGSYYETHYADGTTI